LQNSPNSWRKTELLEKFELTEKRMLNFWKKDELLEEKFLPPTQPPFIY